MNFEISFLFVCLFFVKIKSCQTTEYELLVLIISQDTAKNSSENEGNSRFHNSGY